MRILFLTQVLPYPLDAGAKVRAYHILQYLAARHEVTLVSFCRKSDSSESIAHLGALCREVHVVPLERSRTADLYSLWRSVLTGQPFTIVRDERQDMLRKLNEIAGGRPFDAIHSDQLSMAGYALWARDRISGAAASARTRMVLDAHNAYYLIPKRMAVVSRNPLSRLFLRREARLLATYEANTYSHFDHILTVSKEDLLCIQNLMPFVDGHPRFTMMPICVDAGAPEIAREPGAQGILLLGGLHWPPNADASHWLIREMWPGIREQMPHARLFIIGARPPDDIRALGDFVGIDRPEQAGDAPVVVTGYVKDPTPFIRASAVLAVALRSGGGMRVKIVEAMQWGLPVVSTTVGCEGIDVTPDQNILVADTPKEFTQSLVAMLREPAVAQKLAQGGRRLVAECYDWSRAYSALDGIYELG